MSSNGWPADGVATNDTFQLGWQVPPVTVQAYLNWAPEVSSDVKIHPAAWVRPASANAAKASFFISVPPLEKTVYRPSQGKGEQTHLSIGPRHHDLRCRRAHGE